MLHIFKLELIHVHYNTVTSDKLQPEKIAQLIMCVNHSLAELELQNICVSLTHTLPRELK